MPVYAYRCDDCGVAFEKFQAMAECRDYPPCPKCGVRPVRDFAAERYGGHDSACWPMVSDALAVHPTQAKRAQEVASEAGVPTEFQADGRPIFTSQRHQKLYAETFGYYARNGGYADAQRGSKRCRVSLAERSIGPGQLALKGERHEEG